jgi:RNA polymerase sigma-70 factor (ECF subfamily)
MQVDKNYRTPFLRTVYEMKKKPSISVKIELKEYLIKSGTMYEMNNKSIDELSDANLVSIAGHVEVVFSILIDRHEASMRRFVSRFFVQDADAVEDVLQETFIRMYRFINTYNPNASFRAWLYRIARNEVNRYLRKHKMNAPLSESSLSKGENQRALSMDIFEGVKIKNTTDSFDMTTLLNAMNEKYRIVLLLRYYEELSYEEIGDVLKVPAGTVATLVHRAKKELAQTAMETGFIEYK